jgi:hypothetical protein
MAARAKTHFHRYADDARAACGEPLGSRPFLAASTQPARVSCKRCRHQLRGLVGLHVVEGRRWLVNPVTGERTDKGAVFTVRRPYIFAGQDIGENVIDFETREGADAFVAAVAKLIEQSNPNQS